MIVGLFGLILGGAQKVWSDSGMVAAAQWDAFANYLSQAARGRQPFPNARHLDQLLPYAAAFGVGALLVKRGKKLGGISLPSWFEAIHDADGADSAAFIAFMTSSDSSVPGDGGAGAGGGASGGGSSGAG